MDYRVIIFGLIDLVCLYMIARTILDNPECHLVYKRPNWMQRQIDKGSFYDKIGRYQYLKRRIESTPYNPNDEQMKKDIRDIVRMGNELKAIDKISYKKSGK